MVKSINNATAHRLYHHPASHPQQHISCAHFMYTHSRKICKRTATNINVDTAQELYESGCTHKTPYEFKSGRDALYIYMYTCRHRSLNRANYTLDLQKPPQYTRSRAHFINERECCFVYVCRTRVPNIVGSGYIVKGDRRALYRWCLTVQLPAHIKHIKHL